MRYFIKNRINQRQAKFEIQKTASIQIRPKVEAQVAVGSKLFAASYLSLSFPPIYLSTSSFPNAIDVGRLQQPTSRKIILEKPVI